MDHGYACDKGATLELIFQVHLLLKGFQGPHEAHGLDVLQMFHPHGNIGAPEYSCSLVDIMSLAVS